jgi:hypothetical protein
MSQANLQLLIAAKYEAEGALAKLNRDLRESGTSTSITAKNSRELMAELNKAQRAQKDIDRLDKYIAQLGGSAEVSKGKLATLWASISNKGGIRLGESISIGGVSAAQLAGLAVAGVSLNTLKDKAGEAADAASDLRESVSKTGVTFAGATPQVMAFAQGAADAFGQSRRQALDAASDFGALFKTAGLSTEAAADMSITMTKLGSDLASFKNVRVDDALTKLRSGLVGEAEPLRTMGVLLSEDAVKAKALAMGLASGADSLSEAAKVQARYQIILEQTRDAQGDFARTAEGAANSQRILEARTANLTARFGEFVLPIKSGATKSLIELTKAVDVAVTAIGKLDKTVREHSTEVSVLAGLVAALGARYAVSTTLAIGYAAATQGVAIATGAAAAAQGALNAVMLANPIALAAAAVVGLGVAAATAYKTNDQFAASVDRAMGATDRFNRSLGQIHPELKKFDDGMLAAHKSTLTFGDSAETADGKVRGLSSAVREYLGLLPAATNVPIVGIQGVDAAIKKWQDFRASERSDPYVPMPTIGRGVGLLPDQLEAQLNAPIREAAAIKAAREQEQAATKAATDAEREHAKAVQDSMQRAQSAVQGLQNTINDLNRTPLLGQGAFDAEQKRLQYRIDEIDAAQKKLAGQRGHGAELRTLARERLGLEQKMAVSQAEEIVKMRPQQDALQQALNTTLPEMSLQEILARAAGAKAGLLAAQNYQQTIQQTNTVSVTVEAGGRVSVEGGDAALGQAIGEAVNEALAKFISTSTHSSTGASPQLAGAR